MNKNWLKYILRVKSVVIYMVDVIIIFFVLNFIFNVDGNKLIKNVKLYIVEGKVIGNLNSGRKWYFWIKYRWWLVE